MQAVLIVPNNKRRQLCVTSECYVDVEVNAECYPNTCYLRPEENDGILVDGSPGHDRAICLSHRLSSSMPNGILRSNRS